MSRNTGLFNQALIMARKLETGMVHIGDQTINDEPQVPFGGVKDSGYGRMGGFGRIHRITLDQRPADETDVSIIGG